MNKYFKIGFFLPVIFAGVFLFCAYAFAQPDLGLEYGAQTGLGSQDVRVTIANIIRIALGLLGMVALVIILWGGFIWMTAGGDENKVATAKKILFNGFIGLIIIMSSYAITSFVINKLVGATTGTEENGGGGGGGGGGNPYGVGYLKIVNIPSGGQLCVRNFHPAVVFNLPVKKDNIGNYIKVRLSESGDEVSGVWDYPTDPIVKDIQKNIVIFTPNGDCGDQGPDDCLAAKTDYKLVFESANGNVESTDGKKLVCSASKGNCQDISFITGEGVDRTAPTIKINDLGVLRQGDTVPVTLTFEDDLGIQNVSLLVDGYFLDGASFTGCQKSGVITVNWPTEKTTGQTHTLNASVFDWSSALGTDVKTVSLLPGHCFDGVLNEGESQANPPSGPDCGGGCLTCEGGDCQEDYQCTSGACVNGKCENVMRITNFDPLQGAPGNYMTISGAYFGNAAGTVYMGKTANSDVANLNEWTPAQIVNCGGGNNWTNNQIIVEVPSEINNRVSGAPVLVKSAINKTANTKIGDTTDVRSIKQHFIYDAVLSSKPSLCAVIPSTVSSFAKNVEYRGKNFGTNESALKAKIILGPQEEKVLNIANFNTEQIFISTIPNLSNGSYTTYVEKNGLKSNTVRLNISNAYSANLPIISDISPKEGGQGEYITISGKNFGNNSGVVYFYEGDTVKKYLGSFDFPEACGSKDFWTDKKIIVKFPKNSELKNNERYRVQVIPSGKDGSLGEDYFTLKNTTPAPGICKLEPLEGPLPLPNNGTITAYGEYFGSDKEKTKIYFWQGPDGIASSTYTINEKRIESYTPVGGESGPVRIKRSDDGKMSNPINFTVNDCTQNNNTCEQTNYHCCKAGLEKGICKAESELCEGETKSAGYMWRFTTKTFPAIPRVVERCSADDSTVPTPAPNRALNKEAENTCLSADITVEISANINKNTVNDNSFKVYKCEEGPENTDDNFCKTVGQAVNIQRILENTDNKFLITARPQGESTFWNIDSWYQVVLTNGIQSDDASRAQKLAIDKPCGMTDSAYCYVFKTGNKDCVLSKVAVYPQNYLTKFLEAPVLDRKDKNNPDPGTDTKPFYFRGYGIGDHCIAMNMIGYDWSWSARNPSYANIFGASNRNTSTISALANTVNVTGLSDSAAVFEATASKNYISKTGAGNLVIDLSKPEITEYAPNCFVACPNSVVFAKFNLAMSNNFTPGSVSLIKCEDGADCSVTSSVSNAFVFTAESGYHNLTLDLGEGVLSTNTYYIVNINSGTLFSAGSSINNNIKGSPFARNFVWRFKTKEKLCDADRVEVLPKAFSAYAIGEKKIYSSEVYSAPDECSSKGQKINPYDYNWSWSSSNAQVATASAFTISGNNPFCLSNCLKRGSVIARGVYSYNYPMCGNGKIEAGEDCDSPNVYSSGNCGLNCLFTDKNKKGSLPKEKLNPLDIGAAECGDGLVSAQEDCDLSIIANSSQSSSSMFCSPGCLHMGTSLSSKWCGDNYDLYHNKIAGESDSNFSKRKNDFEQKCSLSLSQCGNGVLEPDEDCDSGSNCTSVCLFANKTKTGSSLFENPPSVCGDKKVSINEDADCEGKLYGENNFVSPWALSTAVGEFFDNDNPLKSAQIRAVLSGKNKSGSGLFNLVCGYHTDEECQMATGNTNYGVGKNSCCYPRPVKISTYPQDGEEGVCPNTVIKISFDRPIDINTLKGNLLIARDYGSAPSSFCSGTQIISSDELALLESDTSLTWYKKIWQITVGFFQKLFGTEKVSAQWCTGEFLGEPKVSYNSENKMFDVSISLEKALFGSTTTYKVILRDGIKDDKGVSIGQKTVGGKKYPHQFTFTTWGLDEVCEVGSVDVVPSTVLFTKTNSSAILEAVVKAKNYQFIQRTPAYSWNYIWSKDNSNSFRLSGQLNNSTSTVLSNNQNGEGEVFVTVSTTKANIKGKSEITVFLCENPWPPFEVNGQKVWPFDDSSENYDAFDFDFNPETTATGFTGANNNQGPFTNFSAFYCADSGALGTKDDLPYMKPVVTTTAETGLLKYYLLTSDKNADAIGIKIFRNDDYLTLNEWLNARGYAGFNTLKIDGYDAAVDQTGNNVYIAALNITSNVYSNVYLLSLSAYASADTKNVFDQILGNLKFNKNLDSAYSRKSCGETAFDENPVGICDIDLDCADVPGKNICLNQKEKIQRNYQRLQNMRTLKSYLSSYADNNGGIYPKITENTFLNNRAFSIWDSAWSEFGSQLGQSLPRDPVNKLASAGTCLKNISKGCVINTDCGTTPAESGKNGYWAGENNFIDESDVKNNGINSGVKFSTGIGHGQSFGFTSGNEKITIKHLDKYNADLENFAISFWFKPTEQTPAVLVKKGGWSDTATNNTLGGFMVEYDKLSFAGSSPVANNGTLRFAVFPAANDSLASKQYFAIDTNEPLSLNRWHHVLVRYATSSGLMYMVVDGKEFQTVKTGLLPHDVISKTQIRIGANNEDIVIGEGLKGQMDEIYFYAGTGFGGTVADYNAKFENICQLHDSQTGWSAEDMRFSFACGENSLAYGYILDDSTGNYSMRWTKEEDGLQNSAWSSIRTKFGLGSNFVQSGFCESEIVSSQQGSCGDGVVNVNKGEKCDPPGKILSSNTSNCASNPTGNYSGVKCSSDCKSTSTVSNLGCSSLGTCGDGKIQIELGELCDDGENNGQLGFCWTNCRPTTTPVCGNNKLDSGEYCDSVNNICSFSSGINVEYEDVVAYILVDLSGSMVGTKWAMITSTLPNLGDELISKGIKFGSSIFVSTSYKYNNISKNTTLAKGYTENMLSYKAQSLGAMDEIKKYYPGGGTPTGEAIDYVINNLFNKNTEVLWNYLNKNLIIITDGQANDMVLATSKISEAGSRGIRVSVFGIGYSGGTMANAAKATGGVFKQIESSDGKSLAEAIMEAIKNSVCQEYSFRSGHSCAWNCKGPGGYCGDGKINGEEECDNGKDNGEGKVCNQYCMENTETSSGTGLQEDKFCGDGITQSEKGEECDNSAANGTTCTIPDGFSSCAWCSFDCKLKWNELII